jgi:hypothetical protein
MAPGTKKRNPWLRLALTVVILFTACGGVVYLSEEGKREAEELRREIDVELPPGSTRIEAEKWFKARGFQPEVSVDGKGRLRSLWVFVHREYILAGKGELEINIEFNENGKVSKHDTDWTVYFP